jgi:hypothetical protein
VPPPPDNLELARRARVNARNNFISAVELGQHVREVTDRLHAHVQQNHFGEGLDRAWRKRRGL